MEKINIDLQKINPDLRLEESEIQEVLKLSRLTNNELSSEIDRNPKLKQLIYKDYAKINSYSKNNDRLLYGFELKDIQDRLINLGFDLGNSGADGKFGKFTFLAIIKLQKSLGLVADGIIDITLLRYVFPSSFVGISKFSKEKLERRKIPFVPELYLKKPNEINKSVGERIKKFFELEKQREGDVKQTKDNLADLTTQTATNESVEELSFTYQECEDIIIKYPAILPDELFIPFLHHISKNRIPEMREKIITLGTKYLKLKSLEGKGKINNLEKEEIARIEKTNNITLSNYSRESKKLEEGEYKIPGIAAFGKALHESNLGRSSLARMNNPFGLKAFEGEESVRLPTYEYINGKKERVYSNFMVFDSIEDAFRGYVKFLKRNPRYNDAFRFLKGERIERYDYYSQFSKAEAFLRIINDAGYSTTSTDEYINSIKLILDDMGLTLNDSLPIYELENDEPQIIDDYGITINDLGVKAVGKVEGINSEGEKVTYCARINRETLEKTFGILALHKEAKGKYGYINLLFDYGNKEIGIFKRKDHLALGITEPEKMILPSKYKPGLRPLKSNDGGSIPEENGGDFSELDTKVSEGEVITIVIDSGSDEGHILTGVKVGGILYIIDPVILGENHRGPEPYNEYYEKIVKKRNYKIEGVIVYSNGDNEPYQAVLEQKKKEILTANNGTNNRYNTFN